MVAEKNVIDEFKLRPKDSINIGLFIDNFFPIIDGVIMTVHHYGQCLSESDSVFVVAPTYNKLDKPIESKYKIYRHPAFTYKFRTTPIPFLKISSNIYHQLLNENADIYHVHSPFNVGKIALKLAKKKNIPVVITFHSKFQDDIYHIAHSRLIAKILTKRIINFFYKCDAVWAPSYAAANVLKGYGYKGEITVMSNGCDYYLPQNIGTIAEKYRIKYGINKQHKNLLFVGQIRVQKNILHNLKVLRELCKEDKSYHFYIVGEGMDEKLVRKVVKSYELEKHVHFLGKISNEEELKCIYYLCDLFFFMSLYDTFALVVREAAAMRLPSLLARNSDAAENIIDNENGFVCDIDVEKCKLRIKEIFASNKLNEVGIKAAQTLPESWKIVSFKARQEYQKIIAKFKKEQQNGNNEEKVIK